MMTVMQLTWKEMLRKRVLLLTCLMTGIFLIAFWFITKEIGSDKLRYTTINSESEVHTLIQQYSAGVASIALGFFFASFVLAFLAIFSSCSAMSGEAEIGVLQAIMPRPLSRTTWYMGRWLGYTVIGILYAALLFSSILIITNIHCTIPYDFAALTRSFGLFACVVPLLVSLSMLGSCLFSAIGNGVVMTMLYGAGWLGGMIDKFTSFASSTDFKDTLFSSLVKIAGLMSILMPADCLQRRMLAELFSLQEIGAIIHIGRSLGPFAIGNIPSNTFLWYAAIYTLLALGGGIWLFRKKDL